LSNVVGVPTLCVQWVRARPSRRAPKQVRVREP
jgi:hypothetical protein